MTSNKNICSIYLDKYSTRYIMKHVYNIQLQFHRFIANAKHNLNLWKTFLLEILARPIMEFPVFYGTITYITNVHEVPILNHTFN